MNEVRFVRGEMIDSLLVACVSIEGRESAIPAIVLFFGFFFHKLSIACQTLPATLELAFLNLRHDETLSSSTLTFSHPTRR